MTIEEFAAIEAIKTMKARYCRYVDTRDWDNYANLFTEDGTIVMDRGLFDSAEPIEPFRMTGREAIRRSTPGGLSDGQTIHHVTMPEITLTSPTTATGIWALYDLFHSRDYHFEGCGYYHETYVLEAGEWRISSLHLKWIHTRNTNFGATGRAERM